jgi:hypothetical protein
LKRSKIKVGIITFFRTINYGTFLQCYALCKMLNDSGIDTEVVDVVYKYIERENTSLLFYETLFKYKNPARCFRRDLKRIKLSKRHCYSNDDDTIIDFINRQNYTHLIYGSDEILKNNKRTFPTIYYPDVNLKTKNISYAVSSNRMQPDKFTVAQKEHLKARLSLYDHITVRDNATINFFKEYAPEKEINKIPDPTFLMNFENSDAAKRNLHEKYNIDLNKPIIYCYLTDPTYVDALNHCIMNPYTAISDRHTRNVSPLEWNTIFSISDIVFTKTFHGTIFSVKNNIPFICFDEEDIYRVYQSKNMDFLFDGNLEDLYFDHRPTKEEFIVKVGYIEKNKKEIKSRIAKYNDELEKRARIAITEVIEFIKNNY